MYKTQEELQTIWDSIDWTHTEGVAEDKTIPEVVDIVELIDNVEPVKRSTIVKIAVCSSPSVAKREAPKQKEMTTTLVIPDCHVDPADTDDRMEALGEFILKRTPDNIICLGDFMNMSSLSHWDKNNRLKMEGIRYKEDILAGNKALDSLLKYSSVLPMYKPNFVWCLGNHELWVDKYLELYPQLHGHIDLLEDLQLAKRGITNIIPYRKYYEYNGVLFTHAPQNAMNQPIGGKSAARTAAELTAKSLVFGHTHSYQQYSCQRHGDDNVIQIYIAGCYFLGQDDYCDGSSLPMNRGISMLTHTDYGRFDIEQISIERMLARKF